MDGTKCTLTLDEFKLFHGIDRALYIILVKDLWRNPSESLHVMGLWLWLERGGFSNVVSKILYLPPFLINELADEALACLKHINDQFPFSPETNEIPLTQSLVKKDISLQFFQENRVVASHEVQNLVNDVCLPALSDILDKAQNNGFGESQMAFSSRLMTSPIMSYAKSPSSFDNSLTQNILSLSVGDHVGSPSRGRAQAHEVSRYDRTMFVTFSKGYPVSEDEVRQFFSRIFGNCIESFHMQEVRQDEQALYARIVFLRPTFINTILNGVNKAKFTINGKHVWMRKFVPKNGRLMSCGCSSTYTCPH